MGILRIMTRYSDSMLKQSFDSAASYTMLKMKPDNQGRGRLIPYSHTFSSLFDGWYFMNKR